MIAEREHTLGELRQENFELYAALKAKGVNIDKIESDDEENDFNEARRQFRTDVEGNGEGDDDDDDERANTNFGFDSDDFVPKFNYQQNSNNDDVDLDLETGFGTTKALSSLGDKLALLNVNENDSQTK